MGRPLSLGNSKSGFVVFPNHNKIRLPPIRMQVDPVGVGDFPRPVVISFCMNYHLAYELVRYRHHNILDSINCRRIDDRFYQVNLRAGRFDIGSRSSRALLHCPGRPPRFHFQ